MEFLLDVLDDRLDATAAAGDDDRERLRRYLEMWRDGLVDPLSDPGVVVVATLDPGGPRRRPRRVVANDGLGAGEAAGEADGAASQALALALGAALAAPALALQPGRHRRAPPGRRASARTWRCPGARPRRGPGRGPPTPPRPPGRPPRTQ